jgi:hypothetical protein
MVLLLRRSAAVRPAPAPGRPPPRTAAAWTAGRRSRRTRPAYHRLRGAHRRHLGLRQSGRPAPAGQLVDHPAPALGDLPESEQHWQPVVLHSSSFTREAISEKRTDAARVAVRVTGIIEGCPMPDLSAAGARAGPPSRSTSPIRRPAPAGTEAGRQRRASWSRRSASSSATSAPAARSTRCRPSSPRPQQGPGHPRRRVRGDLAGVLVDHADRLGEVRDDPHAGRQPRRGRRARAGR